jgi:hypothetical protein
MDKNPCGFKSNVPEPFDQAGERLFLENYSSVATVLKIARN